MIKRFEKHFKLKKVGKKYVMHCPFHKEETPSFIIDFEKDEVFCLGCGFEGKASEFIDIHETLDKYKRRRK